MSWKSLFTANFEESLNLKDDGFVRYQQRDIYDKADKYYRTGQPSPSIRIQGLILGGFVAPLMNFGLLMFVYALQHFDTSDSLIPISDKTFLTPAVFFACWLIWLLLIVLGKGIKRNYLLPYRYHFHMMTFLVWFITSFNLMAAGVAWPFLGAWGLAALAIVLLLAAYVMLRQEIKNLTKLLYRTSLENTLQDKVVKFLITYGSGLLGIAMIINYVYKFFVSSTPPAIELLGLFLFWIVGNLGVAALIIFLEFPVYLLAYYKWKYPEDYRNWEDKSPLEWYGKAYLRKHKQSWADEKEV